MAWGIEKGVDEETCWNYYVIMCNICILSCALLVDNKIKFFRVRKCNGRATWLELGTA